MSGDHAEGSADRRVSRVLLAARWYPSFDLPGRGSFVADQAAALAGAGVAVEVVSWETVGRDGSTVRDRSDTDSPHLPDAWLEAIRSRALPVTPRSWGAAGIPLVRLPAITPTTGSAGSDPTFGATSAADALLAWADTPGFRRPDVVHAHTGLPDGVASVALARRLGVPLVTTEHDRLIRTRLEDPAAKRAYMELLADGHQLVAVSGTLRDLLAATLAVDPRRIDVVPNVVDAAPFSAEAGSRGSTERRANELLWVGNRGASKGTDVLLKAFALLRAERQELKLRLIGRGLRTDDDAELERLAVDLGIADAVVLEPQAPRAAVAAAMARATVFVHPSPWETFGIVAAEALAAGLPVAASPSGGVDEIVGADDRFGLIARDRSPEALAEAIATVLDHRDRYDAGSMRSFVTDRFSADVVASTLIGTYQRLVFDRPPASAGLGPDRAAGLGRGGSVAPDGAIEPLPAEPVRILVGLRRGTMHMRIAALPDDLVRGLLVVTTRTAAPALPLPNGVRVVELDPDRAFRTARSRLGGPLTRASRPRRILRAARHPLRTVRLRRLARRRPALVLESLRAELATFLEQLPGSLPVELVALGAYDVRIVAPLLGERVRVFPGPLRGLVDAWDAAGRPRWTPPERAGPSGDYDPIDYWTALHRRADLSTVGQSARSVALNRWLYAAMKTNARRFVRRHRLLEPPPTSAFDVGLGIGYWVRFWRSQGIARVDGCDLVPAAVEAARTSAADAGAIGEYLVADLRVPGVLGDRTYPLVSCFNVLLHVVDEAAFKVALRNVAGLVAHGGFLLLAEPILRDASYELPPDRRRASRARPLAAYRDPLRAAGLELLAVEPATVLANNPMEAGSASAMRRYQAWWHFVVRRDRAGARWIGPLVAGLDRVAMRSGAAPTTKFVLLHRPPRSPDHG